MNLDWIKPGVKAIIVDCEGGCAILNGEIVTLTSGPILHGFQYVAKFQGINQMAKDIGGLNGDYGLVVHHLKPYDDDPDWNELLNLDELPLVDQREELLEEV